MKNDTTYIVISTGELLDGHKHEDAKRKLAALFKINPSKAGELLNQKEKTIKSGIGYDKALKYCDAIQKTGLKCLVKPQTNPKLNDTINSPEACTLQVIDPVLEPPDSKYSTNTCNQISGWEEGIDLNRPNLNKISFNDIILFSIFQDFENPSDKIQMLLFIKDVKRPLITDCSKIRFNNFPDVMQETFFASLRNFLIFLCRKNPSIIIPTGTRDFINNERAPIIYKGILCWATSLGKCLEPDKFQNLNIQKVKVNKIMPDQASKKSAEENIRKSIQIAKKAEASYKYTNYDDIKERHDNLSDGHKLILWIIKIIFIGISLTIIARGLGLI